MSDLVAKVKFRLDLRKFDCLPDRDGESMVPN